MRLQSRVKPPFSADAVYLNIYTTNSAYQPMQKKLYPAFELQLDIWKDRAQR